MTNRKYDHSLCICNYEALLIFVSFYSFDTPFNLPFSLMRFKNKEHAPQMNEGDKISISFIVKCVGGWSIHFGKCHQRDQFYYRFDLLAIGLLAVSPYYYIFMRFFIFIFLRVLIFTRFFWRDIEHETFIWFCYRFRTFWVVAVKSVHWTKVTTYFVCRVSRILRHLSISSDHPRRYEGSFGDPQPGGE